MKFLILYFVLLSVTPMTFVTDNEDISGKAVQISVKNIHIYT